MIASGKQQEQRVASDKQDEQQEQQAANDKQGEHSEWQAQRAQFKIKHFNKLLVQVDAGSSSRWF